MKLQEAPLKSPSGHLLPTKVNLALLSSSLTTPSGQERWATPLKFVNEPNPLLSKWCGVCVLSQVYAIQALMHLLLLYLVMVIFPLLLHPCPRHANVLYIHVEI